MTKKHKKENIEKAEVVEVVDEKSLTQVKENKLKVKEEKEKIKNKKTFKITKFFGHFLLVASLLLLLVETVSFLISLFNPSFFAEAFFGATGIYIFQYLNIFQFYALWIGGYLLDLSFIILILIFGFYLIDKKESKKDSVGLKKNLKLTFLLGIIIFVLGILFSYQDLKQMCEENNKAGYGHKHIQKNLNNKNRNANNSKDYFEGNFHYYENVNGNRKNINKEFESLEEMDEFFKKLENRVY